MASSPSDYGLDHSRMSFLCSMTTVPMERRLYQMAVEHILINSRLKKRRRAQTSSFRSRVMHLYGPCLSASGSLCFHHLTERTEMFWHDPVVNYPNTVGRVDSSDQSTGKRTLPLALTRCTTMAVDGGNEFQNAN